MANEKETFTRLPEHLAVIMDGNGRWAKKRLLPRTAGHRAGVETFGKIVEACSELGIPYLTVYAFSTENWNREEAEVQELMRLMEQGITRYLPDLLKMNVRLRLLGEIERFPEKERASLLACERELAACSGMQLSVCLSYGGRQELVHAFNALAAEGHTGEITAEDISRHLYTAGMPDPDLVIRTSGECRISNFLLWQSAYAEYYFTEVLWPDFKPKELYRALHAFETRTRRFGRA